MFHQEGVFGWEFGRKANRSYLPNLSTSPGSPPLGSFPSLCAPLNDRLARDIISDVLLHFLAREKHDAMFNQYFFNYGTYVEQRMKRLGLLGFYPVRVVSFNSNNT